MERKTPLRSFGPLQDTPHCGWMNLEESGGVCWGLLAGVNQANELLLLMCIEFGPTSTDTTLLACRVQANAGALP